MTVKQICFAVLAVLGAVVPWYYNLQLMSAGGGFSVSEFVAGGFANPAAASLTVDLLVGSTAVTIWMVAEARRLEMKHWWIYLALIPTVAFAFACPLFLLMRERRLRAPGLR